MSFSVAKAEWSKAATKMRDTFKALKYVETFL